MEQITQKDIWTDEFKKEFIDGLIAMIEPELLYMYQDFIESIKNK
jgi:hypothetical protein